MSRSSKKSPTLITFNDGVKAAAVRHPNGNGWVAVTASVEPSVFVSERATVSGKARVTGDVKLFGHVQVRDYANVYGNAVLDEWAVVKGRAVVGDHADLRGCAKVDEDAYVLDRARLSGKVYLDGRAVVKGYTSLAGDSVHVGGDAVLDFVYFRTLYGPMTISLDAHIRDDCEVMSGWSGFHFWTAYRTKSGSWILKFGCEQHPLRRWPHEEAARRNSSPKMVAANAKLTRTIAAQVRAQINRLKTIMGHG